MFNWVKGRQNTGYEKLRIFQFLNMDCYILRYNVGDFIPLHNDPVPGKRHFRLNFTLKNAKLGGQPVFNLIGVKDATFLQGNNVVLFRSDIIHHAVTEILEGQRIVLTFGIAI